MRVAKQLELYIQSQNAEAAPPLGTVLGNAGVNAVNFCKDFNTATAALPSFYFVRVSISVYSNRTYSFEILPPSVTSLLNLMVKPVEAKKKSPITGTLALRQLVLLAR